jgi:hypothetical protein
MITFVKLCEKASLKKDQIEHGPIQMFLLFTVRQDPVKLRTADVK